MFGALKNLRLLADEGINTVFLYSIFWGVEVVIKKKHAGVLLPDDGDVLLRCKRGKVSKLRDIRPDEHVASLNSLFELAKLSGYTIIKPDGTVL